MTKGLFGTGLRASTALATTAVVFGLSAAPADAQQRYSRIVVFGDSLSDTGNLPPAVRAVAAPAALGYFNGRFSNGPVWAERYASNTNTPLTSVALGGAASGRDSPIDLQFQLDGYLAANSRLDASALYTVWIGGNDYLNFFRNPVGDPLQIPGRFAGNLATAANRLITAGARNVLLFNLPDLGATPQIRSTGAANAAQGTQITLLHNEAFSRTVAQLRQANPGVNIYTVNVQTIFADVLRNPATYGFTNTTTPCVNLTATANACTTQAIADATVFFDGVHPTARNHSVIGEYANASLAAQIDGPAGLAVGTQLAFRMFDLLNEGIQGRLAGPRSGGTIDLPGTTAGKNGGFSGFAFGGYANGERDPISGQLGYDYDAWNIGAGLGYRVDRNVAAGLAIAYGKGKADLDGGAGKLDVDSIGFTGYFTASFDRLYGDLWLGYSYDDYTSKRNTRFSFFGQGTGDTTGNSWGVGSKVGYNLGTSAFAFGPEAGLRYVFTRIDGFVEKGAGPIALDVRDFTAQSLVGSFGGQVSGNLMSGDTAFIPSLRVAYQREFQNDRRSVLGALPGGDEVFTRAGAGDKGGVALGASLSAQTGSGVFVSVGYQGTVGRDDGHDHSVSARVRLPF